VSARRAANDDIGGLTCDNPVLPRNKATGADRDFGDFKCLDNGLCDVRPYVDMSWVRQRSAIRHVSEVAVPLYKVVRIHGSVG